MAETIQHLMNAVYTALTADTAAGGVSTLVGARIYEIQAKEEDETKPYLIFTMTTDAPNSTLTTDAIDSELAIDVIGDVFNGAAVLRVISERVWTLLNRQDLAISTAGFTGTCNLNCLGRGMPTIEDDEYRIMMNFRTQIR